MRRDPLTTFLAVGLLVSVIATAALCYWYLQCSRQYSRLEMEVGGIVAGIEQNRARLQALASDSLEYSKKNANILPLLESVGIRSRAQTNSALPSPMPRK
jgi:hypothetical protein